ncbi:MAG: hypothetical protein Q8J99_02910 [Sulfuritalea sp.]|nr:hypothetical protein [Sulfuritalea sp.]
MNPVQLFPALAASVAVPEACGGNAGSVGGGAFVQHSMNRLDIAAVTREMGVAISGAAVPEHRL